MSRKMLVPAVMMTFLLFINVASATDFSDCIDITSSGTYDMTTDFSTTASYCVNITADDVIVDCHGYQIDANDIADHGVYVEGAHSNISILNCRFNDWDSNAIYFYGNPTGSDTILIDNVEITSCADNGIFIYNAADLIINNSYIAAGTNTNTHPIRAQYVDRVYVGNTHSEGNDGMLHEFGAGPNVFENDEFIANDNDDWGFMYLFNGVDDCSATVTNVTGENGHEYGFYNTSASVSDTVFEGLYLCNADGATFNNITIHDQTGRRDGISCYESDNFNITNSTIINYEDIILQNCDGSYWEGNYVDNGDNDGIYLTGTSTNAIFINNTVYNPDGDCIELQDGTYDLHFNNLTDCGGYAIRDAAGIIYNNYIKSDLVCTGSASLNTTLQEGTRIYQGGEFDNPYIWGNFWDNSTGGYSVICTDSDKNGFCDDVFSPCGTDYGPYSDEYTESAAPRWDLNSTNTTAAGVWTLFSVRWNSSDLAGSNMSAFIFYIFNGANATQTSSSGDQESGEQSEVASGAGEGISFFDAFDNLNNWTVTCTGVSQSPTNTWKVGSSTPSGGTGPQNGDSDDAGTYFTFIESSSGYCYDSGDYCYLTYDNAIDWDGGTGDTITFETNFYGATIGTMTLEENSTGDWSAMTYSQSGDDGNDGDVWTAKEEDASSLTGTGNIRFKYYKDATGYTGDAAIDKFNFTSTGAAGGDDNHTAVEYDDVISGDLYEVLDNITVTVTVSYYNTSGSVNNGNTNTTLWLEIYNGSEWLDEGSFQVTGTGNFSITTTTASILSSWETAGNRDIKISARYMDYNDTGNFDTINWTGVWIDVDSQQEYDVEGPVSFTDAMCDIPRSLCWANYSYLVTSTGGATIKWYMWANTTTARTNTTDVFQYTTESATFVDIIPSQALVDGITFDGADPGSDDNAANNNTACAGSGTCYNISIDPATTVNIDLYHTTTGDLADGGNTMGIENVTHQGNQTSSTGSNLIAAGSTTVTLSYALIVDCSNVPESNVCHVRYWLDVPTGQSPGSYSTTYKYCAVETGAGSGECT